MDFDFRPKLLLFLSVDIIGSTAYKNTVKTTEVHPWLPFLHDFYKNFSVYFNKNIDSYFASFRDLECEYPTIWKCLGDEIVYTVELKHFNHAAIYTKSFLETLREYSNEIIIKQNLPIGLKGTAWVAGFPVTNAEIPMSNGEETKSEIDYVGPSIDIGFRLAKFSTQKQFIISIDLALMIANTRDINIPLFYNGTEYLKGVLRNSMYPIFWIHTDRYENDYELKLLSKTPCTTEQVIPFCEQYINNSGKLMIPFIEGDPVLNKKPEDYDDKLVDAKKLYQERFFEIEKEPADLPENGSTPPHKDFEEFLQAMEGLLDSIASDKKE